MINYPKYLTDSGIEDDYSAMKKQIKFLDTKPVKEFGRGNILNLTFVIALGRQYEQRINNLFKEDKPKKNKILKMIQEMENKDKRAK